MPYPASNRIARLSRYAWIALALAGCSTQSTSNTDAGTGASIDFGDGQPIALADLASDAQPATSGSHDCDPILQDCADAMNPKCSITIESGVASGRCVPLFGMNKEGDTCLRLGGGATAQGRDDCAKGLFCTNIGQEASGNDASRWCRRFCRSDGDCSPGQLCMRLDGNHPADGACVPMCAFYSSDCPMGFVCSDPTSDVDGQTYFSTCRTAGSTPNGDACTSQLDCAASAFCLDPNAGGNHPVCTPTCDAHHPCNGGAHCVALPDLANGGGICK